MSRFKKGDLYKYNKNVYMLIEELEHNTFYLIRVRRTDGRFDIKNSKQISLSKEYLLKEENLNLDKRDLEIYNEFKKYVTKTNFKCNFSVKEYTYTNFNPVFKIRSIENFKCNIQLTKYKKYSNNL